MEARVKSHISIQWVEDGEPRQNKWKKIGTIIEKKKYSSTGERCFQIERSTPASEQNKQTSKNSILATP